MDIEILRKQIRTTDLPTIEKTLEIADKEGLIDELWRPYEEIFNWMLSWGDELYDNVDESYRTAKTKAEQTYLINTRVAFVESDDSYLYKICQELPDSIELLISLEQFSLGHNELINIPASITRLSNLKSLYLDKNLISNLPDGFENLQNLERLVLSNNNFNEIPTFMKHMPKLKDLSFYNNQIDELPEDLSVFENLNMLNLMETGLKEEDVALLKQRYPEMRVLI